MSDFFYNRDRNITGVVPITGLTFSPSYGSNVSFTTRISEIGFPNQVKRRMGQTLNSVMGEYNLTFQLRDDETAQLLDYFESRSGVYPISMVDASQIYQPITGFVDQFSWGVRSNELNEVTTRVMIDNRSPQLKWSGMAFVNHEFKQWNSGESVPLYAIRYFEADSENKFNNFFYCTGEHVSSLANAPFSTGNLWTQNLFFDHSLEYSISMEPAVSKIEFINSVPQRILDKKNLHTIQGLTLRFKNISDSHVKALLHFVESKFGELKFVYKIPKFYNQNKLFYCPSWRHTWNYKNSSTLELDLVEDPLGVLPRNNSPSLTINQDTSQTSIELYIESLNDFVAISFAGQEKNAVGDGQIVNNWNSGESQSLAIFGAAQNVIVDNQRANSIILGDKSLIKNFSATDNYLAEIVLNGTKKLETLDLSNNNLNGLDLSSVSSLKSLKIANNRLTELDISDSPLLTGLYCSGNILSSTQISGCLDALVNFGQSSGVFDSNDGSFVDFENNGPLSGSSFSDASTLAWRGWTLNLDNVQLPLVPTNYASAASHFQQESITGIQNGETIFTWNDSHGNFDASRSVVNDSLRPQFNTQTINARPSLGFNGQSYLEQAGALNFPTAYGIFAVVKAGSSGLMSVFSDYWNRGLMVSGNRLLSKTNLGNSSFGELSGNSYNVLGIYTSGTFVSGAVNSQTPISGTAKFGTTNLLFPGSIGANRYGTSGILTETVSGNVPAPFVGSISEIIITSGVSDFGKMMRDLGAKHGIEIA